MAFLPTDALLRIEAAIEHGRLAHAYLITGSPGAPIESFASSISARILEVPEQSAGGHPDFHEIRPESKSRKILIEQIRNLEEILQHRPLLGNRKVAIIHDADRLVEAAANAFLKTLEEPPPGTHLLLLSYLPEALLPTILSRCIEISLRSPGIVWSQREETARDIARSLLAKEGHAPIPEIFRAVRKFQTLLGEVREEATATADAALKAEKEHYHNRTDTGAKYLKVQDEKLSATTEGRVIAERGRLLDALASVLSERLMQDMAFGDPRIAKHESLLLLRQIERIASLRSDLNRNLNETLALETGFLEIFHSEI